MGTHGHTCEEGSSEWNHGRCEDVTVDPDHGPYYAEGQDCAARPEWNMQVCRNVTFPTVHLFPNWARDMSVPVRLTSGPDLKSNYSAGVSPHSHRLGFVLHPAADYLLNWDGGPMGHHIGLTMTGLEEGQAVVVGICVPMGVVDAPLDKLVLRWWLKPERVIKEACSLEELSRFCADFHIFGKKAPNNTLSDPSEFGKDFNVYFDRVHGVVFRKFAQVDPRGPGDLADCVGGITGLNACQSVMVGNNETASEINFRPTFGRRR